MVLDFSLELEDVENLLKRKQEGEAGIIYNIKSFWQN